MNLEKAEQLALEQMSIYDLAGWGFQWNKRLTAYGTCNSTKRIIYLSAVLTEIVDELHVLNTILHEIAHALVGCKHGHDEVWKTKALEIGCTGNTTCKRTISDNKLPPKWVVLYNDEIVKRYFRKPNKSTFTKLPILKIKGRPETLGKLNLIEYKEYVKRIEGTT